MREWKRNRRKVRVFHRVCVGVLSECVCLCVRVYTFMPRIKARAGGLLPAFYSATRCLSLLSEGEIREGGGEGTKGRGKRGRGVGGGHQCSNHVT